MQQFPTTPVQPAAPVEATTPVQTIPRHEESLLGLEVVDMDGHSVGHVERVFDNGVDRTSGWVAVASGLVDKKRIAVPLLDATIEDKVSVPYPKELIVEAPELTGDRLLEAEEIAAYRHYNLRRELHEDFQQTAVLLDPPPEPVRLTHESVAERAHEIYEGRGSEDGKDLDDWLQAEKELGAGGQAPDREFLTPGNGIE